MSDWKSIVRTVAPALATALGGPLAGVAVETISQQLLGKPDGTEEEISTAIATGGTEVLIKLKQAEYDYQIKLEELGVRDRESARELAKVDYITPRVLAYSITIGFFGVLSWLISVGFPETGREPLLIMLGSLTTAWAAVIAFYYGTTSGSARKTEVLERMSKR